MGVEGSPRGGGCYRTETGRGRGEVTGFGGKGDDRPGQNKGGFRGRGWMTGGEGVEGGEAGWEGGGGSGVERGLCTLKLDEDVTQSVGDGDPDLPPPPRGPRVLL